MLVWNIQIKNVLIFLSRNIPKLKQNPPRDIHIYFLFWPICFRTTKGLGWLWGLLPCHWIFRSQSLWCDRWFSDGGIVPWIFWGLLVVVGVLEPLGENCINKSWRGKLNRSCDDLIFSFENMFGWSLYRIVLRCWFNSILLISLTLSMVCLPCFKDTKIPNEKILTSLPPPSIQRSTSVRIG